MRPRRSTGVASTTTRSAPELASIARWPRCQSVAEPSSALYWHMGETTMRLWRSRSASLIGENRVLVMGRGNEPAEVGSVNAGRYAELKCASLPKQFAAPILGLLPRVFEGRP